MGVVASSSHLVSAVPSSCLNSCPPWQEGSPVGDSSLWTSPLQLLSTWCSLLGADCSIMGPPQVLPGACPSTGSPQAQSFLRPHPPALGRGPPGTAGGFLLPVELCGLQGHSLYHHGLLGNLLHHQELLLLLLHWHEGLRSCISYSHSSPCTTPTLKFFPFLNTLSWRHCHYCSWSQWQIHLGGVWNWLCWTGGSFWLLTEWKPFHVNPIHTPFPTFVTTRKYQNQGWSCPTGKEQVKDKPVY